MKVFGIGMIQAKNSKIVDDHEKILPSERLGSASGTSKLVTIGIFDGK
jgi:hypothetical protein